MEDRKLDDYLHVCEVAAIAILCLMWIPLFYHIWGLSFKPMDMFEILLQDASGFMTLICLIFIGIAVCIRPLALRLLSLGVLDLILINKLYSNAHWKEIFASAKNIGIQRILFFILLLAAIVFGFLYLKKEKVKSKNPDLERINKKRKFEFPKSENSTNNISPELKVQFAAILAIFLEILLFVLRDKLPKSGVMGNFFSAFTGNFFTAFLALIAFYLILHMICIVVLHVLFPNWIDTDLTILMRERTNTIEKKIMLFVCNLFEGFVSLLSFIPDFFNTIGNVLLGEGQLFPNTNDLGDEYSKDKEKKASSGGENGEHVE